MKKSIALLVVLFTVISTYAIAQSKFTCKDSLSYKQFRIKWNDKVSIFKETSWKLPTMDLTKQNNETFELAHVLSRAGITLMATISKQGCVQRMSLVAKKDSNLEMPELISMLTLLELYNPKAEVNERQKVLDFLKEEALKSKSISSKKMGNNTYFFESGMIVDVLTVETLNK